MSANETTPDQGQVVNGVVTLKVPLMNGTEEFVKVYVPTPKMLLDYNNLIASGKGGDFMALCELFTQGKPGSSNRFSVEGVFQIVEKGEELLAGPFAVMLASQKRRLARAETLFAPAS